MNTRLAHTIFFGFLFAATLLYSIAAPVVRMNPIVIVLSPVSAIVFAFLWWSYQQGAMWPTKAITIITTVIVAGVFATVPILYTQFSPVFFFPAIVASVFMGTRAIAISTLSVLLVLALRHGLTTPYTDVRGLIGIAVITMGMSISRAVLESTQRNMLAAAAQAREAEQQARDAEAGALQNVAVLEAMTREQQQLITLVNDLELPAITLGEGVVLVPVVGVLDQRRLGTLGPALLQRVALDRSRYVILDLAGLAAINDTIAHQLLRQIEAINLLGCKVVITSISPTVALTLSRIDSKLQRVQVAQSPQDALRLIAT